MNYTLSFSDDAGTVLGSVRLSPTAVNVDQQLWWLLNRLFPTGLFPYLDPSDTFNRLMGLPPRVNVRGIGPINVLRSGDRLQP